MESDLRSLVRVKRLVTTCILTPFYPLCAKSLSFLPFTWGREKEYETRTILIGGCLGSPNDEERSEMRYVMRIAEFSESSNL